MKIIVFIKNTTFSAFIENAIHLINVKSMFSSQYINHITYTIEKCKREFCLELRINVSMIHIKIAWIFSSLKCF